MCERLIGAHDGIPQHPIGRPPVEGIATALHGFHHSRDQRVVHDVVVEIDAGESQLRRQADDVGDQNRGQQRQRDESFFPWFHARNFH